MRECLHPSGWSLGAGLREALDGFGPALGSRPSSLPNVVLVFLVPAVYGLSSPMQASSSGDPQSESACFNPVYKAGSGG